MNVKDYSRERWVLPTLDARGHYCYVAWDNEGVCLYVGATSHVFARLGQHADRSLWWPATESMNFVSFKTRQEAFDHEAKLIVSLRPSYNVANNNIPPYPQRTPKSVLIAQEQAIERAREVSNRIWDRVDQV